MSLWPPSQALGRDARWDPGFFPRPANAVAARICGAWYPIEGMENLEPAPAWARRLSGLIHRHAGAILWLGLVFAVLSAVGASQLRIDQELRRLLPETSPSVERLDRLDARAGQQADLFVTIRSPSREANIAFGSALARALEDSPRLRHVSFRRDLRFFDEHALLYASLADLLDLRRRVIARVRDEVRKRAFGDFSDAGEPEDGPESLGFDLDAMRARAGVTEASKEYMEADEGRVMVLRMRPTRPATDLAFAQALSSEVESTIEQLGPAVFHHALFVELDGAYVQHQARIRRVQDEVRAGSVAAVLALVLTLALYFRSARAVVLVLLPLLTAVTGALAFGWLAFGVLNIVSAFIFAVLLGLGIDFGIHVLARIRQERSRGLRSEVALAVTLATTGKTTVAGAVSTALAFAALCIADFQGFAQFGQLAAVGVALSMLGVLFLLPAACIMLERVWPWTPAPPPPPAQGLGRFARALFGLAVLVAVFGTGVAGWAALHLDQLEYLPDLKQLGPVHAQPQGPARAGYRDAVGRARTLDPAIALVETTAQAVAIQRQLEALRMMTDPEIEAFDPGSPPTRAMPEAPQTLEDKLEASERAQGVLEDDADDQDWEDEDRDLDDPRFRALEAMAVAQAVMSPETASLLGQYDQARLKSMKERLIQVWSVHAFVPRMQAEKLEVIEDIRARLETKRASLSAKTRAQLDAWSPYLSVSSPVVIDELPAWVRNEFEDADGDVSKFVVLATRGSKADLRVCRGNYAAFGTMRTGDGDVEVAANFFVIPEIFDAIDADGPKVMAAAFAVMVLTALVLLRSVWAALGVVVTVGFSLLWLAAVFIALGWTLNLFNIIVIPMLLGMGQDDALHLVERVREELARTGRSNLARVLREAGGAICVTTLTTMLGFAGILFANHRGLESMAWTAVLGMGMALVASVVILPLLLQLGLAVGPRSSRFRGAGPADPRRDGAQAEGSTKRCIHSSPTATIVDDRIGTPRPERADVTPPTQTS